MRLVTPITAWPTEARSLALFHTICWCSPQSTSALHSLALFRTVFLCSSQSTSAPRSLPLLLTVFYHSLTITTVPPQSSITGCLLPQFPQSSITGRLLSQFPHSLQSQSVYYHSSPTVFNHRLSTTTVPPQSSITVCLLSQFPTVFNHRLSTTTDQYDAQQVPGDLLWTAPPLPHLHHHWRRLDRWQDGSWRLETPRHDW